MKRWEKGSVFMWALFAVTVAGVVLAGTGQVWQVKLKREKEQELLFIGEEFSQAIQSYYNNQISGTRQYPESLEDLLEDKRGAVTVRHLRKIYLDPMTMTDEWGVVKEEAVAQQQGQNNASGNANANRSGSSAVGNNQIGSRQISTPKGIVGVYSLSGNKPVKKNNFPDQFTSFSQAETYQDWQFVAAQGTGSDNQNKATQQKQRGTTGTGASGTGAATSPFGTPGGTSNTGQGTGGGTPSGSPFAPSTPSAPAQPGSNPFAQ